MLLVSDEAFAARRSHASGSLASLTDSLTADLDIVLSRELYIPAEKALLSRIGGRCEKDGTQLEFDPFSPHEHRCTQCGRTYTDALHHRWWIYPYQLWLAERVVHASLLFALRRDERHARFAEQVMQRYIATYASYPNRDNVLGPTRLFFSTYLESIWLVQLCIAADLLRTSGHDQLVHDVQSRVIAPSVALIEQYDEGASNRQVWNNAALLAAALLNRDHARAERILRAPSGLDAHLQSCVLEDGTWYEGDNYHLFAHRGLWYGVTLAERAGMSIDAALLKKFRAGFATPFASALPDLTFPSRKDSQYAVSLRQWRTAESCELGLARTHDVRLSAALARLYANDLPAGDTGRARSSAEAERNVPACRLRRTDLGWRSLLCALPDLPDAEAYPMQSANLRGQGYTVFRRDAGDTYIALDWGQSGGGHGHPDRLNLTFVQGDNRWLDDLGTGSYVDDSLFWYRSTLAHNAPMINGNAQDRVDGDLVAYDERHGVGWIAAKANLAPGVDVRRAIIVTPEYFIDEVRWFADSVVQFDLPMHFDGSPDEIAFSPTTLENGGGMDDGYRFVRNAESAPLAALQTAVFGTVRAGRSMRAYVNASRDAMLFRARAPGQPATTDRPFYLIRCHGTEGVIRTVWAWAPRLSAVSFTAEQTIVELAGEKHVHRETPEYWQMELTYGGAHSGIELYGIVDGDTDGRVHASARDGSPARRVPASLPRTWELGEAHYRRSEQTWSEAGRPTARVSAAFANGDLVIDVDAQTGPTYFVPAGATNPYDNEQADINGHGIQLYVRTARDGGAWVVVPAASGNTARARQLDEWGTLGLRVTSCAIRPDGFSVSLRVPLGADETGAAVDVLINETEPGRQRRRGQLVLSGGAGGEFVYLRGDRHDPGRLLPLKLA